MNHFQKKRDKLERLRGAFFLIGLIISCGFTFLAFEWTTTTTIANLPGDPIVEYEDDFSAVEPFEIEKKVEEVKELTPPVVETPDFKIVPNETPEEKLDEKKKEASPLKFKEDEWKTVEKEPILEEKFRIVEHMPEFIGGEKAMFAYLAKNVKYPRIEVENGISGTVHVQFVIGKNGKIKDIEILRGVSDLLDKEAIRVVKAMPAWKPGKQRGKAVSVIFHLPINFKIK